MHNLALKSPVFDRPAMSLIAKGIGPHSADLYIGGMEAARDIKMLRERGVGIVVNCAVNLDINLVEQEILPEGGGKASAGYGPLRYYKFGMIDGYGNPAAMMLSGYLLLRGAIHQNMPKRETYPFSDGGNILVNCRAGRSRSTALVSLFLHLECPDQFPRLEDAVAHVRTRRELRPEEWFEAPKPMLIEAAQKAVPWARALAERDAP
ncbi:Dual specificity phosphatase, catalytic domain [Pelagimonas phthalicica]|uniref:Dual specificity phosphatase, catalytic domain n=2 Tax=Pelagimonas phthalicica TaxID=1037362 RepID=A0A238JEW1_9RHOB|nr:dual specificity protein phosphatase [Pelagimonas phthalicica]TDS92161.1 dual specificity protein phosphatase-like protein [Pelagimonas phthalicica]SMX29221.1 Dual specificity phosphatase, catalytic domain [Pelagimonas phthalicica]